MIKFFAMLFCNHDYEIIEECRIKDSAYKDSIYRDYIVGIVYILKCKKCGKIKKKEITF